MSRQISALYSEVFEKRAQATMDEKLSQAPSVTPTRYGYFVLQATAQADAQGAQISGVLEDLSTGSKQTFDSAAEVAQLMSKWAKVGQIANQAIPVGPAEPTQNPREENR